MKSIFVPIITLFLTLAVCAPAQCQTDLEKRIQMSLLYQPMEGENYNAKAKIEQLGQSEEVKSILLEMLERYKNSELGTEEYLYFAGATRMLGELKEKRAIELLTQILFDQQINKGVRAYAARSLGQIDPVRNKQSLLKALANASDYFGIRIEAAEALATTKDPQVLKVLERYSREERDVYVKQKFEKAAQDLRAKIRSRP